MGRGRGLTSAWEQQLASLTHLSCTRLLSSSQGSHAGPHSPVCCLLGKAVQNLDGWPLQRGLELAPPLQAPASCQRCLSLSTGPGDREEVPAGLSPSFLVTLLVPYPGQDMDPPSSSSSLTPPTRGPIPFLSCVPLLVPFLRLPLSPDILESTALMLFSHVATWEAEA